MYAAVGYRGPETSYVKAVDVWLFICIVLVVLTLFQFAVVITIQRKKKEREVSKVTPVTRHSRRRDNYVTCGSFKRRQDSSTASSSPETVGQDPAATMDDKLEFSPPKELVCQLQLVERIGQLGIPIIFFLCNVVYWLYYLSPDTRNMEVLQ
nr:glycine receptor subunit alpha-2-like [Cherax quadricarinatus]